MRITLLNFAPPEPDPRGAGIRWWHKSGARWPATIPDRKNDGTEFFPYPFLLSYLKSLLEQDAHQVVLLDGCLEKWTTDQALAAVAATRPDYVVFETSEQTELPDRLTVGRLGALAPVVLIGPNVSEDRDDLLDWEGVHAAVPGEYLLSTRDFFRTGGPGMQRRQEIIGTTAMDALPFAHRDPVTYPRYNARFKTTPAGVQGVFVSMWGCQYRCNFCIWVHSWWSRSSQFQKAFSIERLSAELDRMQHDFPGITSFYDDCDNHDYRKPEAERFAEMMGRRGLPWAILTRADTFMTRGGEIDRDMWRAYREAGLYAVKIGVEGGQAAMDATNKRLDENVVREFVPFMQDLGISVYSSFMLGIPNTDDEADHATMRLIADLADHRPDLFEYLISYCDVTRVVPFTADTENRRRLHDGQLAIEDLYAAQGLPGSVSTVAPNNFPL
ncbi:radical SAM protein [Kitasatospora sp. NPDC097643]|uniref:B12-binding domain-containing radical SAM protein n=1 Tax=Kitasatospora sp. NPDC097643 TaxID=3157230 RepID=UPI00332836FC